MNKITMFFLAAFVAVSAFAQQSTLQYRQRVNTHRRLLNEMGLIDGSTPAADYLAAVSLAETIDAKLGSLEAELAAGQRLYYCVQGSQTQIGTNWYGSMSTTPSATNYTIALGGGVTTNGTPINNNGAALPTGATNYVQLAPGRGRITANGLGVETIPAGIFRQSLYFANNQTSGRQAVMQVVASIVDADGSNPQPLATSSEGVIESLGAAAVQRIDLDFVVASNFPTGGTDKRLLLDYYFKRAGITTGTGPTLTRHAGGTAAGALSFALPSTVVMLTDASNADEGALKTLGGAWAVDSAQAATNTTAGLLRYRVDGTNAYLEAVMQTGTNTWAWTELKTTSWEE